MRSVIVTTQGVLKSQQSHVMNWRFLSQGLGHKGCQEQV